MKKRKPSLGLWLILTTVLMVANASAATFTVTNTNDSGAGSLRQAITDATAASTNDTIAFNIAGGGVKKIAPLTPLPNISGLTNNALTIDGTTQPGWSVGNLVIELSGENLSGATAVGLEFISMSPTPQSFVRGLAITRFTGDGIYIQDSINITIEGCHIGTDGTGTIDLGNRTGIEIKVGSQQTHDITIGGTTAATRNVISGNNFLAINIFGGDNYFIKGNYIGTDRSGNVALPNGSAMQITAIDTIIGGATTAERNVISGNNSRAIILDSSQNTVQNNYIGVGADGFTPLGNGSKGIDIINSINFVNIGDHVIANNVIANNLNDGISIFPGNKRPTGVKITANSIYNNDNGFGSDELGIDLEADGITPNDAGDADTGPNNFQNFPVLTSATVGASGTTIQGTLNSQASTSYRIEFFSSDTNKVEGKTFLGFQNVTTNASGNATINAAVSGVAFFGQFVTATATRNATPLDTSEFSAPIAATLTSFVVTNTNDSGAGSLRQAILDANAAADVNEVTFAITPINTTTKTINLQSALPTITNPVAINGLSQGFATCGVPKVELNGTNAGASTDGLTANSTKVLIQGLTINRFGGDGITLLTGDNSTLKCLLIGTNNTGSAISANGGNGILLSNTDSSLIEQSTLSGNGLSGVRLLNSNNNIVRDNIIGLDRRQLSIISNSTSGVSFSGNSVGNLIGGTQSSQANVIAGNNGSGVLLSGSLVVGNSVKGNFIGINSDEDETTFGNNGPGVLITTSSSDNTVGGTETGAGNVIARNINEGVSVNSATSDGNRILQNSLYDNRDLGIDLGTVGVTANDANDGDTGANNLQNFPAISKAETFFGGLTVTGTLNSTANSAYRIEVFSSPSCDASGNGEGQTYLGAINVTTVGNNASFTDTFNTIVPAGQFVTATATRLNAPTDTSEFSVCRVVTDVVISSSLTVTNTSDSGTGSLRQAIINANSDTDLDQITFNISGAGVHTITPATALPEITDPVIIDGLSQPGSACGTPLIELNGTSTASADGLLISGSGSVRGLIINRFDGDGIEFRTSNNNIVKCSFIGVSADGLSPSRNGRNGLYFNKVSNNTVGGTTGDGNVISSNTSLCGTGCFTDAGIQFFLSTGNTVQGNILGLDKTGLVTNAFLNARQENGITMINTDTTLIGGTTASARNIIVGNDTAGIQLSNSDQNTFKGNYIGVDASGTVPTGTTGNGRGMTLSNSVNNQIGGTESGAGNVISANNTGINLGASSDNTVIEGNKIGTDAAGMTRPVNQQDGILIGNCMVKIGGRTASARNIISGNATGIRITNNNQVDTAASIIEGNYIGLGVDGVTVIANTSNGILLEGMANGNTIGGGAAGAGNVISGGGAKLRIDSSNNLVQGNLIGTDATGTVDVSTGNGIELLANGTSNTIGGPSQNMRNIISGVGDGIKTASGATTANGNLIQNNFIGTAINGTSALPNTLNGILLESSNNTIISNTIAFNTQKGVVLLTSGTGNRISVNSIHSNTNLGIDLGDNGVTANDTGDGDLANNLQNYPVITSIVPNIINATLNSTPNSTFAIEFFVSPTADASGFGEGKTFLGATNVTTNVSGNATFSFSTVSSPPINDGNFITATATSSTGDTSEFSLAVQALSPTAANVNIQGRVLASDGRAISIARIMLTDSDGNTRTAVSNPFGYYRFLDVPSGESYVISVRHKSYEFHPPSFVINLSDEITDLTLVGTRREGTEAQTADEPAINVKKPV